MIHQPVRPKACPTCGTPVTARFLRLKQIPVNCSALWQTADEARKAPRGDIELAACVRCGLIFNAVFDPNVLNYDLSYDNTLSYSPAFRSYAGQLAERLVSDYDLHGKTIVEIGCGNGEFLDRLCELGGNHGTGFDPSAPPRDVAGKPVIYSELFSAESIQAADFVCCRHVLEHIPDPRQLLANVRQCLSERGGRAYFEVPNARSVLEGSSTWDLIYPHCSYFSAPALRFLFEEAGFEVLSINTAFDGQFLAIETAVAAARGGADVDAKSVVAVCRLAERFDAELRENIFRWSRFIEYACVEGRKLALWGAGAKGVTFLNVIPGAQRIERVIDLNPRKQGTFVPGTAQQVIAPADLLENKPDIIIVLNPVYEQEIRQTLLKLGLNPIVALTARLPFTDAARVGRGSM